MLFTFGSLHRAVLQIGVLVLLVVAPLAAQPSIPEPLRPWVPWVLDQHPDLPCPLVGGRRLCAWPGRLELDLNAGGGSFRLEVVVDRDLDLPLPGDAVHWPQQVTSEQGPVLMRRLGEKPGVFLGAGRHRVRGRFRWNRLPESLPVPPTIALVDLRLDGQAAPFPKRDGDGLLWLVSTQGEDVAEDHLELEVHRRLEDGVPVTLTTRLLLRVSGSARALEFGQPLPPGFALSGLGGDLPLRWLEGDRLVVQARPGTWEVTLWARSRAPVTELSLRERPAPWPDRELWAFKPAPEVRALRLSGAPSIDPQRTSLPEEWKTLAVYQREAGNALELTELRRGLTEVPPDGLSVSRTWWLEQAGDRFAVRDVIHGELFAGGRLQAVEPAELGRLTLAGGGGVQEQVLTLDPESAEPRAGVEVRHGALSATAELAYPRQDSLPAVGWDRDVQELSTELRLPPGWTLVAATGVDQATGSWIDRWNLLDLFLLLILSLASWRLDDRRWGLLALLFLGLAWHEPRATGLWMWWLALLPVRALLGVLPLGGWAARLLRALRWGLLVGFSLQLAVFCAEQWRTALFPVLEGQGSRLAAVTVLPSAATARPGLGLEEAAPASPPGEPPPPPATLVTAAERQRAETPLQRSAQIDPNTVVQTGLGVPEWSWQSFALRWNGPVTAEQRVRLWLLSPAVELWLSLLRIAGGVALGWLLVNPRRTPGASAPDGMAGDEPPAPSPEGKPPTSGAVASLLIAASLVLASPPPAVAQPSTVEPAPPRHILQELERRLVAPPPCHPRCVEVPRLELQAGAAGLRLLASVHAAAPGAWRLPGPATSWTPARVMVDGQPARALRLGEDGFFLLRLEPGIHRIELSGPARESLVLELPLPPRTLLWQGSGWTLGGLRPDQPPPRAVRLERQLTRAQAPEATAERAQSEPWLELVRELDLGVPWLVHNQLVRRGAVGSAVLARVPLLPGESVTTSDVAVEGGEAILDLGPGETVRRFDSTLEEAETVTLRAPEDRPWTETWELSCSPVWNCRASGLAPTRHMEGGLWKPRWQPWPGEEVTLELRRPSGAPGKTTTIDRAHLRLEPGRRLLEASLELAMRTSRGGEEWLQLPSAAALQSLEIDGHSHPLQAEAGRVVFTLEPGAHEFVARWRQEHRATPWERMPAVRLSGQAVNIDVTVEVPSNRWLLWARGPGWGPVVQFWQYLLVLALAAIALSRLGKTPLRVYDWLLLGAGLTQLPLFFAAIVAGWFVALGLRDRARPAYWWSYDVLQLALVTLGFIALASLYAAIHAGLLFQPDMQVVGPGSQGGTLHWYVDRVEEFLPQPWVLWLPLWVWRTLMLLWSLWLAARLLRWLPWCWRRLTVGPFLAGPKSFLTWRGGGAEPSA